MPSESEMEPSPAKQKQKQISPALGFSFGVFMMTLAGAGLYLSGKIQSIGYQDPSDPGPRFFPQTLLFFLALSGIIESAVQFRRWRQLFLNQRSVVPGESQAERIEPLKKRYLMTGVTSMVLLVIMMPWTGFPLASILFISALMPVLGIPWKLAIVYAFGMTGVIWLVFVWGLQAPLPRGVLW